MTAPRLSLAIRVNVLYDALAKITKEYEDYRDSMYDCFTNRKGEYDCEDDRNFIVGLDAVLNAAKAALGTKP